MRSPIPHSQLPARIVAALAMAALVLPAAAHGAPKPGKSPLPGALTQLSGAKGCLVDRSTPAGSCGTARALKGPGPFMGSRAIAISPDDKYVYVASSKSDAIAIFKRDVGSGTLTQAKGIAGCVAAKGAGGCATAVGLDGPNSVAISADGHSLYATSRASNSVTIFRRNVASGRLTQLPPGFGCVSSLPIPGCAGGRALLAPDVLVVSPDGSNVYIGSFAGNAVAVFARDRSTGALAQPGGTAGCLAEGGASGCAPALALKSPEGMAISRNGTSVYVATAVSSAVLVLARDPSTGALAQATDGSGCIVDSALTGCTPGVELSGANAVAVSPGGRDVYATSLFSNSVTSFSRAASGALTQKAGTAGCLVWLRAVGCSFGRALSAPEGLAVSPDGLNVYAAAFATGAIAVLNRSPKSGAVAQKPGPAGCFAARSVPDCMSARALRGVSSIALSADGRYLYSTSFGSNAVDVFRRATSGRNG
jgi:DNA-binding beta-propeller fold protein YncE